MCHCYKHTLLQYDLTCWKHHNATGNTNNFISSLTLYFSVLILPCSSQYEDCQIWGLLWLWRLQCRYQQRRRFLRGKHQPFCTSSSPERSKVIHQCIKHKVEKFTWETFGRNYFGLDKTVSIKLSTCALNDLSSIGTFPV